jgi:hypothetical protein
VSETVRLTVRVEDAGEGWVLATIPDVEPLELTIA